MFWNRKLSWSIDPIVPRCMGFLPAFYPEIDSPAQIHEKKNEKSQFVLLWAGKVTAINNNKISGK